MWIGTTGNRIGYQIRKPVSVFRENWKPNAKKKKRKIRKPQGHQNRKIEVFERKTDKKNSQNRKPENPNAPLSSMQDAYHLDFEIDLAHRGVSVALERRTRRSEVRFLMRTQNFFFVPRLWQEEKHISLYYLLLF